MEKLNIYPKRNQAYIRELRKLETWNTSQRNRELITQFQNYLFSTGSGKLRVAKLSSQMRRIVQKLDKDLDKADKQDIQRVIAYYNQEEKYSDETKADYRRVIKQFFKWFKSEDGRLESSDQEIKKNAEKLYQYLEKEVYISCKHKDIDFRNILTEEDINLVVEKGCKTIKEKAFITFLHETGARATELLSMQIRDILIRDNYATARLYGKTGERKVPIVKSLPYIVQWIDLHPNKDDEESYLWIGESLRYGPKPLLHHGAQKLINRCFEKVELKKKRNLHWFRHSRATLLAPHLTESLLCKYMGWTLGSRQVRRYVHLCTKQLEDAYLDMLGVTKTEEEEVQQPQQCACGTINTHNARYCFKCGKPLSVEIAVQDQELMNTELNKSVQLLLEIAKDPELMQAFEQFRQNNGKPPETPQIEKSASRKGKPGRPRKNLDPEIIKRFLNTHSIREVASMFDVSPGTIHKIKKEV